MLDNIDAALKYLLVSKTYSENEPHCCFLCFKKNSEAHNINDKFAICIEEEYYEESIVNIMNTVLPNHKDILTQHVCEDCLNAILKVYIIHIKSQLYYNALKKGFDIIEQEMKKNLIWNNEITINLNTVQEKLQSIKENDTERIFKYNTDKTEFGVKERIKKYAFCAMCQKKFKTKNSLKLHLKHSHVTKPCPYCQKVLKTNSHYKIHIKTHETGVKRNIHKTVYKCDQCEYKSISKTSLVAHKNKIHKKIKPYNCMKCNKAFHNKSNLTEHIQIHKGDKHICELCGVLFATKSTRDSHLRLHYGDKNYTCEVCGDRFVTASRKTEHCKRKHGVKSEECCYCGKKFSLKKVLNKHVKLVHKQL